MAEKYLNKYRIPSIRLQNWDYGSNAIYFVTICTKNRTNYFGNIVVNCRDDNHVDEKRRGAIFFHDDNKCLNGQRRGAKSCASTVPQMQLTDIGEMANRCWNEIPIHFPFVELGAFVVMPNHIHGIIVVNKLGNGLGNRPFTCNKFGPQSQNLASIVRGFKVGVTKYAHSNNLDFEWQPRFYEHIVRNDKSYERISEYITNNPKKWLEDKFFAEREG